MGSILLLSSELARAFSVRANILLGGSTGDKVTRDQVVVCIFKDSLAAAAAILVKQTEDEKAPLRITEVQWVFSMPASNARRQLALPREF